MAYPKPDAERQRRNEPTFTWTQLPASVDHPVPPLPELKRKRIQVWDDEQEKIVTKVYQPKWSTQATAAWEDKWTCPQSSQWTEEMARQVETWLYLYESFTGGDYSGATLTGLSRIEDKLGLNPKAMLQLRWRHHPSYMAREDSIQLASVAPIGTPKTKRVDPRVS